MAMPGSAEAATVHLKAARQLLEEAARGGVPEDDLPHLNYRLGKAGFYTGDDPERVARLLQQGVEQADDKAEGWSLLAGVTCANHSRTWPRPCGPMNNCGKYRSSARTCWDRPGCKRARSSCAWPSRRRRGRCWRRLARRHRPRCWRVPAPCARTFQDEARWSDAAALWQALLGDARERPADAPVVLYNLGLCFAHLDQPHEAAVAWEECIKEGKGDEAAAAGLSLAELR